MGPPQACDSVGNVLFSAPWQDGSRGPRKRVGTTIVMGSPSEESNLGEIFVSNITYIFLGRVDHFGGLVGDPAALGNIRRVEGWRITASWVVEKCFTSFYVSLIIPSTALLLGRRDSKAYATTKDGRSISNTGIIKHMLRCTRYTILNHKQFTVLILVPT